MLRNWSFSGQTCSTAPFFKRFSTSNGIVSFSCYFVLVSKGMEFDTSWVSAKYSDLLSVTVGIFRLQNKLFTNCCADDNSPSSISCGISLKKVTVLVTWVFELCIIVAVELSSGTGIPVIKFEWNLYWPMTLRSEFQLWTKSAYHGASCWRFPKERWPHVVLTMKILNSEPYLNHWATTLEKDEVTCFFYKKTIFFP